MTAGCDNIYRLLDKNKKILKPGSHITDQNNNLLTIVGYDGQVYLNITNTDILNKLIRTYHVLYYFFLFYLLNYFYEYREFMCIVQQE